jgi:hypothetical protein
MTKTIYSSVDRYTTIRGTVPDKAVISDTYAAIKIDAETDIGIGINGYQIGGQNWKINEDVIVKRKIGGSLAGYFRGDIAGPLPKMYRLEIGTSF